MAALFASSPLVDYQTVEVIKATTTATTFKKCYLLVKVRKIQNSQNNKMDAILCDQTTHIKAVIPHETPTAKMITTGLAKDRVIRISDFLVVNGIIHLNQYSNLSFDAVEQRQWVVINPSTWASAETGLEPPTTIRLAKTSPKKTRVNLKGKVTKVYPKEQKNIRTTNKMTDMLSFHLKDNTSSIKVTTWGNTAQSLSTLSKGDIIQINKGVRSEFKQEEIINTHDFSTVTILPDDASLGELSDSDDLESADTTMPSGTWTSIGQVQTYEACPKPACFYKKLEYLKCPNCGDEIQTEPATGIIAKATIHSNESNQKCTYTIFRGTIDSIFGQWNLPTLDNDEIITDTIFDRLPANVSYNINGTIITTMRISS